jgi:hypothetical protein
MTIIHLIAFGDFPVINFHTTPPNCEHSFTGFRLRKSVRIINRLTNLTRLHDIERDKSASSHCCAKKPDSASLNVRRIR